MARAAAAYRGSARLTTGCATRFRSPGSPRILRGVIASAPSERGLHATELEVCVAGRRLTGPLEIQVSPGRVLGIRGPSGSGKTTLLRCLARLRDPDRGTVTLDGRSAEELGFPAYRSRVVYVAQRPAMLGGTVLDNLAFAFGLKAHRAPLPRGEAERLLAAFELRGGLGVEAARLSEGERQRVGLVRALLLEPSVLLLDEPTSGLDARSAELVEAELRARLERGCALVLVTHDAAQLDRLAHAVLDVEAPRA